MRRFIMLAAVAVFAVSPAFSGTCTGLSISSCGSLDPSTGISFAVTSLTAETAGAPIPVQPNVTPPAPSANPHTVQIAPIYAAAFAEPSSTEGESRTVETAIQLASGGESRVAVSSWLTTLTNRDGSSRASIPTVAPIAGQIPDEVLTSTALIEPVFLSTALIDPVAELGIGAPFNYMSSLGSSTFGSGKVSETISWNSHDAETGSGGMHLGGMFEASSATAAVVGHVAAHAELHPMSGAPGGGGNGLSNTPEPFAMGLAGLGLVAIAIAGRKSRFR